MIIVVINDNTLRLSSWQRRLEDSAEVVTFTHPNYLLTKLVEEPESLGEADYFLFDRVYYGQDLFKDPIVNEIKSRVVNPKAKYIVTSAHHEKGDVVEGFDLVLPGKPRTLSSIQELLLDEKSR